MAYAGWRVESATLKPVVPSTLASHTYVPAWEFVATVSGQDATIGGSVEFALEGDAMDVQFITSVAVITPEPAVSRRLYVDRLACH